MPPALASRSDLSCARTSTRAVASLTVMASAIVGGRFRRNHIASQRVRRAATLGGVFDVAEYYRAPKDEGVKEWVMQQTMFRVKDPKRSLDFYTKVLGMQLITVGDFPQWGFTVYFVGYPPEKDLGPVPEN